jgi:hypothetical protein
MFWWEAIDLDRRGMPQHVAVCIRMNRKGLNEVKLIMGVTMLA